MTDETDEYIKICNAPEKFVFSEDLEILLNQFNKLAEELFNDNNELFTDDTYKTKLTTINKHVGNLEIYDNILQQYINQNDNYIVNCITSPPNFYKLIQLNKNYSFSETDKKFLSLFIGTYRVYRLLPINIKIKIVVKLLSIIYSQDSTEINLYRGQLYNDTQYNEFMNNNKVGDVIQRRLNLSSWSSDLTAAKKFSNPKKRWVNKKSSSNNPIIFVLKPGAKAFELGEKDFVDPKYRWNKEWLVGGYNFRITQIETNKYISDNGQIQNNGNGDDIPLTIVYLEQYFEFVNNIDPKHKIEGGLRSKYKLRKTTRHKKKNNRRKKTNRK